MEKRKGFLSNRIVLKGWQKLLIILGCTVIAALGAWVYCEKIATPVYVTTVRTQLHIEDIETLMTSSDPTLTTEVLDIPGGLRNEIGEVGSKGKGDYYRYISDEINEATGERLKPKELKAMINISTDPADGTNQTVLIAVKNSDPEKLRMITDAAVRQFGVIIFGAEADSGQVAVTESADESGEKLTVAYRLTDEAAAKLPSQFKGKTLNLVTPMENALADDDFCERIALTAGISAKAADIRKRVVLSTTADSAVMTLTAAWNDPESAQKLATAAGTEFANRLFGGEAQPWQAATDEPVTVSENVKEWPITAVIVTIAALIALIVSYALFSQQPLFDTMVVVFFIVFTFICVFPFYYLFINTISDNNLVAGGQINFVPKGIHLMNYDRILGKNADGTFKNQDVINALKVTLARTLLGTALMVLTSAWAGYLVTKRKMWHRSFWYRALVITMYFNAGLIPWYTNMLMLGLTGNFLAYILPGMVAPYNIILVKTYIESIPGSLEESAIIDGASTYKVFLRIILPLSVPILATIAIFGAVGNWNSFQDSLLLMSSAPNLYTLQHRLYVYLNQTTSINTEQISEQMAQNLMNTGVTTKYTIAMITIIPILLVYPIMQRYFVKGIMLGAVKG